MHQTKERIETTPLEIAEMEALCTRVAEYLGWRKLSYSAANILIGIPPGRNQSAPVPAYGRYLSAAWEIVDFLSLRGIRTQIEIRTLGGPVPPCEVEIGDRGTPFSRVAYPVPAIALCLAFDLAAKDVLMKPLR